jgi:hypothetical protein
MRHALETSLGHNEAFNGLPPGGLVDLGYPRQKSLNRSGANSVCAQAPRASLGKIRINFRGWDETKGRPMGLALVWAMIAPSF